MSLQSLDKLATKYFLVGMCRLHTKDCLGFATELHHIINKSLSLKLRYDPANLYPVCRNCHTWIHANQKEFNESLDFYDRLHSIYKLDKYYRLDEELVKKQIKERFSYLQS